MAQAASDQGLSCFPLRRDPGACSNCSRLSGAAVGGPVVAAVGGVTGAVAGTIIDPPPAKVVTYVREAPAPAAPVVVEEKVVVGHALPETVVVTPVPENPKYGYAIVNNERVIIEPSARKVIHVNN